MILIEEAIVLKLIQASKRTQFILGNIALKMACDGQVKMLQSLVAEAKSLRDIIEDAERQIAEANDVEGASRPQPRGD